jgi:hypothetical protein
MRFQASYGGRDFFQMKWEVVDMKRVMKMSFLALVITALASISAIAGDKVS